MSDRLVAQLAATSEGALPEGEHLARLVEVRWFEKKKGGWCLRLISQLHENGRSAVEIRNLAKSGDDPFALTDAQKRGLVDFASRLNVHGDAQDPQATCVALASQVGAEVTAVVKRTPHQTIVKHYGPKGIRFSSGAGTLTTAGEIVDYEPAKASFDKLIQGLTGARLALALVAEACYEISRDRAYVSLSYETLAEFLADPRVSLSRSEFFRFAAIWERLVIEGGVDPARLSVAGPSKLDVTLPAVREGRVSAEEAVTDAEVLGIRDLREKYGKGSGNSGEQESQRRDCPRCEGIPEEVLDDLRERYRS
jgi:hypothetical protein